MPTNVSLILSPPKYRANIDLSGPVGVTKAAEELGVSAANRDAMDNWDGDLDERLILRDGRWVDIDSQMAEDPPPAANAQPNEFYQQIYEQATPLLARIIHNNADSDAINKVKELNGKILAHNVEEKLPSERLQQGIIHYQTIVAHVSSMIPYQQALAHNPADVEARKKWDDASNILKESNKREGYPATWLPDEPPPAPATSQTGNQQSAQATEAPEAPQPEAPQPEAPQPEAPQPEAPQPEARRSDARPTTSAAVEWPWTTGLTAASERIMAYRPSGRGHTCVVETGPKEKPIYVFKSGQEAGLLELRQYMKLPGIKRLSDPETKRRWSYKDRDSFKELLWVAVARYKNHDPTKRGRSPEALCCTMFDWGLELLPRTELQKVIGNASADQRIGNYCTEVGVTPPWDVEPENRVPRKKKGMENVVEASTETKAMENKLAAIESQVQTSLESLVDKMEKRMASTEEKVDKLDKSATSLAMIVEKLVAKVGLSPSDS
jgi:hypothetical protein